MSSDQSLLGNAPKEEHIDTIDNFLTHREPPTNLPPILHRETSYKVFKPWSPKFEGILPDNEGKIKKRQVLGDQEYYKKGAERKQRKILDLKNFKAKQGLNVKTLQAAVKLKT